MVLSKILAKAKADKEGIDSILNRTPPITHYQPSDNRQNRSYSHNTRLATLQDLAYPQQAVYPPQQRPQETAPPPNGQGGRVDEILPSYGMPESESHNPDLAQVPYQPQDGILPPGEQTHYNQGIHEFINQKYPNEERASMGTFQVQAQEFKDPQYIVVNYLHDICKGSGWIKFIDPHEPCVLKKAAKCGNEISYRYLPPCDLILPNSFVDGCARFIRADTAVKLSFPVVHAIMGMFEDSQDVITLDADNNIQVINSVSDLAWVRKYQYCAFVREDKSLLVWGLSVNEVIDYVRELETKMVDCVWKAGNEVQVHNLKRPQDAVSVIEEEDESDAEENIVINEKSNASLAESEKSQSRKLRDEELDTNAEGTKTENVTDGESILSAEQEPPTEVMMEDTTSDAINRSTGDRGSVGKESNEVVCESLDGSSSKLSGEMDLEGQEISRPLVYIHAFIQLISLLIIMTWVGSFAAQITRMIRADGQYWIIFGVLYLPPTLLFSSFFATSVVMVISYLIGPVSQVKNNSRSYSVKPVERLKARDGVLPHLTIQCPVYKEKLDLVLKPTFQSIQRAMHTYELQGGSANIFVNDDGLQLVGSEEALARIEFYEENNIGYVSRPADGDKGFVRKGRFKKASNMNYCLHISKLVDAKFHVALEAKEVWTMEEESALYLDCLDQVVKEEGKCWAGGDILLGEFILLIDSDTRVPEDCFIDSVSEMFRSPDVAIIQHASGVMMVVNNFWERLIAWFTDMIYFSISIVSANGADTASFVGHNAFLLWPAVQECAYYDPDDGLTKYWSETHVSEDFEMSLKLAGLGYIIRLATYHNQGFQEGVSLTVYDEVTRWSKYAFGCAEIMFHPMKEWWRGKIFTSLFIMFLRSNISLPTKYSIMGYMGTYFAIASSFFLLVVNYFVVGWYNWGYAAIYIDSMTVFVAVMVVFGAASQVAYCVARYRIFRTNLLTMLLEFRWSVLFGIFMGGLSWHLIVTIVSFFFSLNLQWGATAKDVDDSNFFKELPKAVKNYRWMYLLCISLVMMMVCLAYYVPYNFRIRYLVVSLPLGWSVGCHFFAPIVLNPQLMTFAW